jgi:heat-inducible transcriptional repressor
MTTRREAILEAIVREYIDTANPVSSLIIVQKYDFPYSPATVRAEMAELEQEGLIVQPHTSAGRVPTEKGYRYFVDMIQKEEQEIAIREERSLKKRIESMHSDYNRMFNAATLALAELTCNVGISTVGDNTFSHGIANLFRQPEFLDYSQIIKVAEILDNIPSLLRELPKIEIF